nr:hypothetical protein JVH1_5627 [Rhodococcus sp. JVH1]
MFSALSMMFVNAVTMLSPVTTGVQLGLSNTTTAPESAPTLFQGLSFYGKCHSR